MGEGGGVPATLIDGNRGHQQPITQHYYLTYQYTPVGNANALLAVLAKHTVKRLRELVRTRINLTYYSKLVKQELIVAIMKRKELFADIAGLESTCSKNTAEDKILNSKSFYATIDELKAVKRSSRETLKLPPNQQGKAFEKQKTLVNRVYQKINT